MQRTSAWPLALSFIGLIVYASLYPFSEWRDQGIAPWAFLSAPWPRYWTGFDVASNVVGYVPAGFLLALAAWRTGRGRRVVLRTTLACGVLSLVLEALQSYLPDRVASNVDLALNILGGWLGAVLATLLEKLGAIDRWSRFRARWFLPEARGGLVLLALWPAALLFPAAVPLGLGQVLERVEAGLVELLQDTPFLEWVPVREVELQPLVSAAEFLCVLLGMLIPCLVGFCIIVARRRRLVFILLTVAAGVLSTSLSAALSYGPQHAWDWLQQPVIAGLALAAMLAVLMLTAPPRLSAAVALLSLGVYLSLLNQAPADPYFSQTLQTWEQGRFIRFHGLAQWLGWAWPYASLLYLLSVIWRQDRQN